MKYCKLLILALVFCGVSGTRLYSQTSTPEETAGDELIVSMAQSDLVFDPHHAYSADEAQIFTAIYEGLVTYDPKTLDPVPGVASRWDISPDGKTYTFHLRENARYSNGDKVTAAHFRDTWLRLINPAERAEYASLLDIIAGVEDYRTGKTKNLDNVAVRAVSESVLEVKLTDPASHFLKILCHHSFVPIHPAFLTQGVRFSPETLIGNGPYSIVRKDRISLILGKNAVYWDVKNVAIQFIRILFEAGADRVTDLFNRGRIDWIASGDFDINKINNRSTLVYNPSFATQYFYFSQTDAALKNDNARTALAGILPWEQIRKDMAFPAVTLVPKIPQYPEIKGIPALKADEAKKLLSDAGYPDGKDFPLVIIAIQSGVEYLRTIAETMIQTWSSTLGVKATIREIPGGVYFSSLESETYSLALLTWIGDFADPLTFLQMWTSNSNLNYARYENPEYDRLIRLSMTQKGEQRYKTLGEAEKMLISTGAVLPLNHSPAINMIDLDIFGGWHPNPLDIHPFKFIKYLEFKHMPGIAFASD